MLRNALLECQGIHRVFGIWLPLAVLLAGLAAWFQEADVLRLSGVQLYWGAVRSSLLLALALVPLAWLLGRRPDRQEWLMTKAHSRWGLVLPPFLGMGLYGAGFVGAAAVIFITLDRISVLPAPFAQWASAVVRAWVFLLPLAAVSPGLASRPWGLAPRVVVFSACAVGSLLLTAPGSPPSSANYSGVAIVTCGVAIVPPILATAAGILLSLHLVLRSTSH